ncbi:uncharacterized protein LOC119385128 [Rhipicephalus sanguineus]|uniref:uncharacterized protein LOC119385128 n=1 Tax=Rhipicephalus sanguineus TaxID=34632 RepID=UPI001893D402|nr:uncharacterized protein LOC119385128 [Rhipicephalus sanguineus]
MTAYESFQSLLSFFRVTGCCPVGGLAGEHPRLLEDGRKSWYTLYSVLCLAIALFTAIDVIHDSSTRGSLEARLHIFFSLVLMAQCYIVFGVAVARSRLLVSFLRQCVRLENLRPPSRSRQKSVKRLLRILAVYAAICSCMQCASKILALLRSTGLRQIVHRCFVLVGALYIISWSMMTEAIVCLASQLIGIYIEVAANDIEIYGSSSAIRIQSTEFLCEARLTFQRLRQLFLTAEKFLSVPLLVTFAAVMTNTCTMMFFMVTTEIHLGYVSKAMAVGHVVHTTLTLAVATSYAQNVTEQAGKLKQSLLTWIKAGVDRAFQKEVFSLVLIFKEETFTFNACGFFNVESPIFRPMVGVVVTYTLVLYQTKLAALSWSPPPCAVDANSSLTPIHQPLQT